MQNGEGETNAPVSAATLKDERLEQVNGGEARIPLFDISEKTDRASGAPDLRELSDQTNGEKARIPLFDIREKTDRVFSAPDPREQLDQL